MITLPDGIKIDMRWKSVCYVKKDKMICFSIEPTINNEGVVFFPSELSWRTIDNVFSNEERLEIIFLLERIAWKRKLKILIVDIIPNILNFGYDIVGKGSMESTEVGRKIEMDHLFNPESPLTTEQVHELYISLEKKFAEKVEGVVKVYLQTSLKNSVFNMVTLPILKKNNNVCLEYVEVG